LNLVDGIPIREHSANMFDEIKSNIFPAAHKFITDWGSVPWHTYAHRPHSSQALAFSVFGTLSESQARDQVLNRIATRAGLADSGPWSILLEWQDATNQLKEPRPTQVDAVAISATSMLLFECKFTEPGGQCSQVKQDRHKRTACNTRYERQTNVQNGISARCALSGKGIRYWDFIPEVFGIDAGADHTPCPFAFDNYQWMRNSLLAHSLQKSTGKPVRLFVVYCDIPGLPTADKVRRGGVGMPTLSAETSIHPLSYQDIITMADACEPSPVWGQLDVWMTSRVPSRF
jgi:hypothetical protein